MHGWVHSPSYVGAYLCILKSRLVILAVRSLEFTWYVMISSSVNKLFFASLDKMEHYAELTEKQWLQTPRL